MLFRHLPRPLLLVFTAALLAPGCTPRDNDPPPQKAPATSNETSKQPLMPEPQKPLDREGMIVATLRAATAAALLEDDSSAQADLKGRRFEVRIRFGCTGSNVQASSGWTHDAAKGVLRARVRADVNSAVLEASDLIEANYEGAVGFFLRRPWMLADGCPDPRFSAMAEGPAIALTQLFTADDSRVQRPEAIYEAVAQVTPSELPSKGLNLVLSGRLKAFADGRAIRCAATDGPPACIVSTVLDRVAIEDPIRDVIIAEFGGS